MIPEVIARLILILTTLIASLAPDGASAQHTPATTLYVYDDGGTPLVSQTPRPDLELVEVLRPTPSVSPGARAIPLSRARPYLPMVLEHAGATGLEPALVLGVIEAESHFDPRAVSHAGAVGMMQLMPVHWKKLSNPSDPHDPDENVRVGCEHLARLLTAHRGDLHRALAAYNAGSGTVRRVGGPPAFTRSYVSRIMRARARWRLYLGAPAGALAPSLMGRHLTGGPG